MSTPPEPPGPSGRDDGSLTHIDEHGRARMVDVMAKPLTRRVALARCAVVTEAGATKVPGENLDWPDFGVPMMRHVVAALSLEVGCLGRHGRTGTAFACLAILTGHPHGEVVAWARATYLSTLSRPPNKRSFSNL